MLDELGVFGAVNWQRFLLFILQYKGNLQGAILLTAHHERHYDHAIPRPRMSLADSDVPPHELITCVRLTRIRLTKLTKSDETETLKLKGKDRPTDSETKTKNRVMVTSWSRSPEIAST